MSFSKSQIWKTSDLSNDDLLSDMSSYTDAMDFFDNLHNEKPVNPGFDDSNKNKMILSDGM